MKLEILLHRTPEFEGTSWASCGPEDRALVFKCYGRDGIRSTEPMTAREAVEKLAHLFVSEVFVVNGCVPWALLALASHVQRPAQAPEKAEVH